MSFSENGHETTSGIYPLFDGTHYTKAFCNMSAGGYGGWTVFQRRKDGSVNFFRNWTEYENGFGSRNGEFWLGNTWLHFLTSLSPTMLRIDFDGGEYVEYTDFYVGDAASKYKLRVSGHRRSNLPKPVKVMPYHNNMSFSTYDQDNDLAGGNCAAGFKSAWWFNNCHHAHLNGVYGTHVKHYGVWWAPKHRSFVEMKLRRRFSL